MIKLDYASPRGDRRIFTPVKLGVIIGVLLLLILVPVLDQLHNRSAQRMKNAYSNANRGNPHTNYLSPTSSAALVSSLDPEFLIALDDGSTTRLTTHPTTMPASLFLLMRTEDNPSAVFDAPDGPRPTIDAVPSGDHRPR